MNIITLENLSHFYTERMLFDETSFYLQEGEKVGIIGINGTGKSTLLRIMAGIEEPDKGKVITANNLVIRFLRQHPQFDENSTILESVMKAAEHNTDFSESDAKTMLTRLGFFDFDMLTGNLSGGQQKRLALAAVLLPKSDVLILDEPTNHLDADMSEWLENYLRQWKGSLVMVTHDRYFLDSICNRIVELDKGKIYSYQTNYAGFLESKTERMEIAQASERKRQSILRTELEWVKRGARARSTKQKSRLERFEKMSAQNAPELDQKVEISSVSSRLGRTTVELKDICKGYGERKLIQDFSYIFLKNDRIGIIGSNGCGKTTLMKILLGEIIPDSGTVTIGQTVKIGYYSQMIEDAEVPMDPQQRIIDYIKDGAEYIKTSDGMISASQMLERFLFISSMQYTTIGNLSGGEKRRLNLLRVLMEAPNVLVLDEPTNDLDITTLTILEDYLDHFIGIVIIVSHDRYFLDRIVGRIFEFGEDGHLLQYEGNYEDYLLRKETSETEIEKEVEKPASKSDSVKTWKVDRKRKLTYQEQKDYETIEQDILELEAKIEKTDEDILKAASDFVKLNKLTNTKQELQDRLDEKMERWMFLEDLIQEIQASD